jgi:hypothetical protein
MGFDTSHETSSLIEEPIQEHQGDHHDAKVCLTARNDQGKVENQQDTEEVKPVNNVAESVGFTHALF